MPIKIPFHFSPLYLALIIGILSPLYSSAQIDSTAIRDNKFRSGKWGIELNYLTGQFLKHQVPVIPKQLSQGFELNYFRRTLGEKNWHKGMNYPEIGVALTFYHFGDNPVYGDAISVMGYAKFYMVRSKVVNFYMRIGGGYGVVTRQYNAVKDSTNKVISTPVNFAVQLRLGLDWKINQWVQITTAVSFNHFSNAGMKLPNYGINIPGGTIGIRVFPQPKELRYNCAHDNNFKKNEILWKVSVGIQQLHYFVYNISPSTRIYPVPAATIAYARYINYGIKFYGGLSFEYFPAIRDYLIQNDIHTRYGPTFDASIPSAIVGNEFIIGRLSMFYSVGAYLWKNTSAITPVYFKLGMNLYLFQLRKHPGTKFFFGNNVKSHMNVAQYNEFSLGGTF